MAWSALTPAIFQFTYKECKKNPNLDQKNLKKIENFFSSDIVIKTLGISSQIIFLRVAPAVVVMIDTGCIWSNHYPKYLENSFLVKNEKQMLKYSFFFSKIGRASCRERV